MKTGIHISFVPPKKDGSSRTFQDSLSRDLRWLFGGSWQDYLMSGGPGVYLKVIKRISKIDLIYAKYTSLDKNTKNIPGLDRVEYCQRKSKEVNGERQAKKANEQSTVH